MFYCLVASASSANAPQRFGANRNRVEEETILAKTKLQKNKKINKKKTNNNKMHKEKSEKRTKMLCAMNI